jgi:tRNA (guanine-N7-)-methyltransferase
LTDQAAPGRRSIRSFVLRKGRTTRAQARALAEIWPRFGIEPDSSALNYEALFGRGGSVILEIGFGDGQATWHMAQFEPDSNFIGIEVHPPGVGHLLLALEEKQISNVRVASEDAVDFLAERIPPESLDGVRIYFPDPWPKKRHHKRRLIQTGFVELLAGRMKRASMLHLATDWEPYAEHMLAVLGASGSFENQSDNGEYCVQPAWRPVTKYERRGLRLGHRTRDLIFRRC